VLGLWNQVPDAQERAGTDRVAVLSRCAGAAYAAGDNSRAAELVRQALPLVDETRHPQRAGLLHEQLAHCLRALADPDALGAQQQAVRLVPPGPSVERARVLGSLALYLGLVSRFEEARRPAPASPWAPPLATSATLTPGSPSWRRHSASPRRPAR
jgi:hypothetical protein